MQLKKGNLFYFLLLILLGWRQNLTIAVQHTYDINVLFSKFYPSVNLSVSLQLKYSL
jgi:hypothetical protein